MKRYTIVALCCYVIYYAGKMVAKQLIICCIKIEKNLSIEKSSNVQYAIFEDFFIVVLFVLTSSFPVSAHMFCFFVEACSNSLYKVIFNKFFKVIGKRFAFLQCRSQRV